MAAYIEGFLNAQGLHRPKGLQDSYRADNMTAADRIVKALVEYWDFLRPDQQDRFVVALRNSIEAANEPGEASQAQ